jgi:hypothetical protein
MSQRASRFRSTLNQNISTKTRRGEVLLKLTVSILDMCVRLGLPGNLKRIGYTGQSLQRHRPLTQGINMWFSYIFS